MLNTVLDSTINDCALLHRLITIFFLISDFLPTIHRESNVEFKDKKTASKSKNNISKPTIPTELVTTTRQTNSWKNCGKKWVERQDSLHVKGQTTTISQHPWMAAIYDEYGLIFCGGTIASNTTIISAAHCFTEKTGIKMKKSKIQNFTIHLGNKKHGVDVFIDEVIIHPLYSYKAAYHDLAVVKLKKEIILTYTQFVCP